MPDLFEPPPPLPPPPGPPSPDGADLVFVWLEHRGGTVAVSCPPGRIGILDAGDAEAYLPLVRIATARGQVLAATADVSITARDLLPATVRVVPNRDLRAGTASPGG